MAPKKRSYSNRGARVPNILEKGLDPLARFDPQVIENEEDASEDAAAKDDSEENFPVPNSTMVSVDVDLFDEISESIDEPVTAFDISGFTASSYQMEPTESTSITSASKKQKTKSLRQSNEAFIMLADSVNSKDMDKGLDCIFIV